MSVTTINGADYQFAIERRTSPRKPWKATSHVITAKTANSALRKFGCADAFKSTHVKVTKGHRTGKQYRAVKVF